MYLGNTELPKKWLYNYLQKQLTSEPLVLFGNVTKEDAIRFKAKCNQKKGKIDPLSNLRTENEILRVQLDDLKKKYKRLKYKLKQKNSIYTRTSRSSDNTRILNGDLTSFVDDLSKNLFVNSVQVSYLGPSFRNDTSVQITINDLYVFKNTVDDSLDLALTVTAERATEFMSQLLKRGSEDVIPRDQIDDTMLLVALFELKTGFSIDNVIVNLKNLRKNNWTAKAVIDGVLCSSGNCNKSKLVALNGLFSKFLLGKQSCVLST